MRWPRGVRARLAGALVLLVAVTAIALGVTTTVFVEARLRQQALADAAAQATFDLTVTVPGRQLPAEPTIDDVIRSGLTDTFRRRNVESVIDLGAGENSALGGQRPRLQACERRAATGFGREDVRNIGGDHFVAGPAMHEQRNGVAHGA